MTADHHQLCAHNKTTDAHRRHVALRVPGLRICAGLAAADLEVRVLGSEEVERDLEPDALWIWQHQHIYVEEVSRTVCSHLVGGENQSCSLHVVYSMHNAKVKVMTMRRSAGAGAPKRWSAPVGRPGDRVIGSACCMLFPNVL